LARLGHGDHERLRADDRVAVAELGGEVHLGGEAREALDHGAADRRGVERGAAGDEYDALEGADRGGVEVHVGQDDGARLRRQAARRAAISRSGAPVETTPIAYEPVTSARAAFTARSSRPVVFR